MAGVLPESCPSPDPLLSVGGPVGPHVKVSPWQQSESCNITNMAMVAQANMNTTVSQDVSGNQSNLMYFHADHDQTITDSKFDQSNKIDVSAMQAAYISDSAQQQLMLQLMQQSTAVSKGLAILPQSSDATNIINGYMKASINMNTNVSQTCAATQSSAMIMTAGHDQTISDSTFSQSNDAAIKCTQIAVNKNVASQSVAAQISQVAAALSEGLSFFGLVVLLGIIIVCIAAPAYIFAGHPEYIFMCVGAILIFAGSIWLIMNRVPNNETYAWFGYSRGIENSESACKAMYIKDMQKSFDTPNLAQNYLMGKSGKQYAAFDWTPGDGDTVAGTAQFWKYANPSKGHIRTSEVADNCASIHSSSKDASQPSSDGENPNILSIRPDAYVNMNLNGKAPDAAVIAGDAVLDNDTGNLWMRMPPGFNTCNPSAYGGGTDSKWTFVKPSTVNASSVDNVFTVPSGSCTCSAKCCTAGCGSVDLKDSDGNLIGPKNTKTPDVKVYVYIDPNTSLNYNLDATHSYGQGTYKYLLTKSPDQKTFNPTTGTYKWDYNSALGNATTKIADGDFLLVVFPMGPTHTSSYFTPKTGGGASKIWPTSKTDFEQYNFGQSFFLYKAVQNADKTDWVPYIGDIPPMPTNIVSGTGPSVDVAAYNSTCMKMYKQGSVFGEVTSIAMIVMGFICVIVGFAYTMLKKKEPPPVPGPIEIEMQDMAAETRDLLSSPDTEASIEAST